MEPRDRAAPFLFQPFGFPFSFAAECCFVAKPLRFRAFFFLGAPVGFNQFRQFIQPR